LVAATWCAGVGLAVLTTVTLVGWIAAPRTALGPGLPGVFRTAVNFWLVAHHAGFSLPDGRVGLLPLGLVVLPGALLYRGGGWVARVCGAVHLRGAASARRAVIQAALALAVPYAALAGVLALAAATDVVRPSAWQALVACFLVAAVAGGLGAARAFGAVRGKRVRSGMGVLLRLLPARLRSLMTGVLGALGVLVAFGAVLVGASLAVHHAQAVAMFDELAPGIVGGALLLVVELAYLPNAVIWGMAYAIGPGFAVGRGTSVSPTGVFLDVVPSFPPLAALPEPGPAPALSLLVMAAPFAAGVVGGLLTVRVMPSPAHEAAPVWGFVSGVLTGGVTAVLAALSGGPMGGERLTVMGPSPWRVGMMAALQVGTAAAITAWPANVLILRRLAGRAGEAAEPAGRPARRRAARPGKRAEDRPPAVAPTRPEEPPPPPARRVSLVADPLEFEDPEPVLAPRKAHRPRARDPLDEPFPQEIAAGREDEEPGSSEPEDETAPPEPAPKRPERRDEALRTETRGGAIYILRDEPPED